MSYRFELETSFYDFICVATRRRSITITRSFADASATKYRRASSSSEILRAPVEPSQECNQPVWQIAYMPCANPILRSTIPADGSASATLGLRHDGGWIPPGVQAFGDLARQPWSPLDGEKGVYRRTREGSLGISSREREACVRTSDRNETGRIPASTFDDVTNNVPDIVRAVREHFINPGISAIWKLTHRRRGDAMSRGIVFWFHPSFR